MMEENEISTTEAKVIELLNEAATSEDTVKIECLWKVKEIVLNQEPQILEKFLSHILSFQADRNVEVRNFIISFIADVGQNNRMLLSEVLPNLLMMLSDSSVQIQKKVIQTACNIYNQVIEWLANMTEFTSEDKLTSIWNTLISIKTSIVNMVDSDNDGIRNQTVKFMQAVILSQSPRDEDTPKQKNNDLSIYDIPATLKFIKRKKLEDEALIVFDLLVRFHTSKHISSINLMTCMGALSCIATLRPQFMGKVITALESVHTHLPPSLSDSQVSSVRKHLKTQLLGLLKNPNCVPYQQNVMTLLTDLGATHSEVMKMLPKEDEVKKRKRKIQNEKNSNNSNGNDNDNDSNKAAVAPVVKKAKIEEPVPVSGIDITESWVYERLTPTIVAELVMNTMENLPQKMPTLFNSAYTPIAAAGTPAQIKHVSRLLATQLHVASLGPGASVSNEKQVEEINVDEDSDTEELKPKPTLTAISTKYPIRIPRMLKVSETTKSLTEDKRDCFIQNAVERILKADTSAIQGGAMKARIKILTSIATTFGLNVRDVILSYIEADLKHRIDLALAWLYEEYSILQGFYKLPDMFQYGETPIHNYNTLLCSLGMAALKIYDQKDRETILLRLYLEAPVITENSLDILKEASHERVEVLRLLKEMVARRPRKQLVYLNTILEHTSHQNPEIYRAAIQYVVDLYDRFELRNIIEEYATFFLSFLRLPKPPEVLFGPEKGIITMVESWTENLSKACLLLYLALLPVNEKLIHELAKIYAVTDSDVKRVILRLIEPPIQGMGMESQELLKLVENFPNGAETLITRILHIITEKKPPSRELVSKIRDLYQSSVSDVRFLIPVLSGLSKSEIVEALPKLIKLNPNVVKEVFNRLLTPNAEGLSPLTPQELLIALHNIDPNNCELKFVIKATSLCFANKEVYTQEVLAVVIQNLMDITPLPTLLMRTVIQSLSYYPRLIGFCMNILQRLILKQVWKHKKVWEGFIKCCERAKPNSFQVLLQLPPEQLTEVFETSPELKQDLFNHVLGLADSQRSHIPKAVMDVLYGVSNPEHQEDEDRNDPDSPTNNLTIDIREEPQEEVSLA